MDNLTDFASVDDGLDPSKQNGFDVHYEREVPVELRSADASNKPSEVGALEAIRVKICLKGDPAAPTAMRVELSSESNLFFHYCHEMDERSYGELQEGQRLMVDFPEYYTVLLRMLNACIKEPHAQLAVFIMKPNGSARLDFIQNMEYKFVELLSCDFEASEEEIVRQHITYRYNHIKSRLALVQARLADVNALVKIKAPSLFVQLQRSPARPPGSR